MSEDPVRPELTAHVPPYRCAYLGGTFDCLHRGHLAIIAAARGIAATVCVSVNTDEFAARYKRRPLMPLADRLLVIGQLRGVDRVIVNAGCENSKVAILFAGADVIVHGSDWDGPPLLRQMGLDQAWLDARGIALRILPYTEWTCTSALLAAWDARRDVPPPCVPDLVHRDVAPRAFDAAVVAEMRGHP